MSSIINPVLAARHATRNQELAAFAVKIEECVERRTQSKIDGDCLAYEAFTLLIDKLRMEKAFRANYWQFDDDGVTQVGV
jgi:hypothetical protein